MTAAEGELVNHVQNDITSSSSRIYLVTDGSHSKHTKINYRLAFDQFLRNGTKTTDLQVLLDYKPKVLEEMIIGYIEMMRDNGGKAHQTIKMHCAAIFYFFRMNDITLNTKKIMRFVPRDESAYHHHHYSDRAYGLDEICRILEYCDLRTKVIVLLMVSSGMRTGANSRAAIWSYNTGGRAQSIQD